MILTIFRAFSFVQSHLARDFCSSACTHGVVARCGLGNLPVDGIKP